MANELKAGGADSDNRCNLQPVFASNIRFAPNTTSTHKTFESFDLNQNCQKPPTRGQITSTMDHLPRTHEMPSGELEVPYLAVTLSYKYPVTSLGWEGFRDFAAGRSEVSPDGFASQRMLSERDVAFLQEWLFFGLLREAFARPNYCFDPADFVRRTQLGKLVVTTKKLPLYIWYWQAATCLDKRADMEALEYNIDRCLRTAHSTLHSAYKRLRGLSIADINRDGWPAEASILLSIALLGDYLTSARTQLLLFTPGPTIFWEFPFIDKMMMNSGWCVGEVSTLRKTCTLSNRYYLASLSRQGSRKRHNDCHADVGCRAHQLDYSTYQTRHHRNCPGLDECQEVGPDAEDIVLAIKRGGRAVVNVEWNAGGTSPRIIQVGGEGGSQVRYVAISHVWSDGLGNPWRNGLRYCQLQHLQKLVNALYEEEQQPAHFWIDTLGIPVGKAYIKYRQAAIQGIEQTFRNADKVLVIDDSLQFCKADLSWVETLMRIQYSSWMTRLWTLLEGRLASKLFFQFANKAISGNDLLSISRRKLVVTISQTLRETSSERLRNCPSFLQLAKALATSGPSKWLQTFATLPVQSDPEQEELRQEAIEQMRENMPDFEVGEFWRQFVSEFFPLEELCEDDELVKEFLDGAMVCPVALHAFNAITSVRGSAIQVVSGDNSVAGYSQDHYEDAAMGFRSRKTSRSDDETLCLGVMLNLDLQGILQIPTMDWRIREFLELVDHQKSPIRFVRRLGINVRQFTDACHLKRMALLLSQIHRFPLSIIFWNTPRLESHSWAPRSLLDADVAIRLAHVKGNAVFGTEGLELTVSAHKLSTIKPSAHGKRFRASLPTCFKRRDGNSKPEQDILTITSTNDASGESASSWLSIQFVPDDKTIVSKAEQRRTWQDYIDDGDISRLAVLYRSDSGILVRINDVRNGVYYARCTRLVSKSISEAREPRVSGTLLPQQRWCIS